MFRKIKIWPLIVLIFSLLAARDLLNPGYFPMHDDLQMMRQLELEKCFLDGQIPCRWVPDMGYGFGFPLFNFYPPLPYLIGEVFRIVHFSFVDTAKALFVLSFFASGITMYLLAKEFFGKVGGLLSAIFYIWGPYHAVDVFVRGAMNEAWALVFFPLIFWSAYKLVISEKRKVIKWVILLALSYSALLMSHNLMVLIFTPFFGIWVILHLWREKAWSRLPALVVSGIWAFGLSAFFSLPALVENKFTWIRSQIGGYYDYTAHFVSLKQLLFSRFWGYGPSVWVDADDGMSFQIGHAHWILSLLIGCLLVVKIIRQRKSLEKLKSDPLLMVTGYLLAVGWFSAFLTHLRSIFIYQKISSLSYIQFPWRFLTITTFAFSFIVGFIPGVISRWKEKHGTFLKILTTPPQIYIFAILSLIVVLWNWEFFRVERIGPVTDLDKFSGEAWRIQQTAGIYDYLPIYAQMAPTAAKAELAEIIKGDGEISDPDQGSSWGKFDISVYSEEALARVNILYFPEWKVFVKNGLNSEEIKTFIPEEEKWGRMWIKLPKGEYQIYARLFNTTIRTVSNLITVLSWLGLGIVVVLHRKNLKQWKV